ncbi:protein transport protein sft2 [Serendipita sp. 411]|nr:protein transport protein sft2 [Serendipita sp. 411]
MSSNEQAFRSQLSQFRWARGNNNDARSQQNGGGGGNAAGGGGGFFSRTYNSISTTASGYIPLRNNERTNEEEAAFALSRWERLVGFIFCILGAAACFAIAFFIHLPLFALRPAKFATSITLGSILVMLGFIILIGPLNQLKHLISPERLPFSAAYIASLVLTIYFSMINPSYIGAIVAAVVQVGALMTYVAAYFPGGVQTLKFGAQMLMRGAGSVLPI